MRVACPPPCWTVEEIGPVREGQKVDLQRAFVLLPKPAGKAQGAACMASPSRDMPSARHFFRRQCWHRFRLVRSMGQFCCRVQE